MSLVQRETVPSYMCLTALRCGKPLIYACHAKDSGTSCPELKRILQCSASEPLPSARGGQLQDAMSNLKETVFDVSSPVQKKNNNNKMFNFHSSLESPP